MRLVDILRRRGKLERSSNGGLDMEPFEVLRDMIREGQHRTIGGPPQLMKVYRHLNVVPFGIGWSVAGKELVCVHGRPLLEYEKPHYPILNPDSLNVSHFRSVQTE